MGYCIVTRYHGPTNYRGSRVIATGPAPELPAWDAAPGTIVPPTRATVAWDYGAGNPGTAYAGAALGEAPHDGPGDLWLRDLFADEYCAECGGDAQHHSAVPFLGNPFARCDYPPDADGSRHPAIEAFRATIEAPR